MAVYLRRGRCMNEESVEFRGPDGRARRGILALPDTGRASGTGVLLLPSGLKYRVGPHRLNVDLARSLVREGYPVLRFDPLGIGESDGRLPGKPIRELWLSVERGRFVQDTLQAARELRERAAVKHVVVGGLCGGAVTALLATALGSDVIDGVLSINTAVSFSLDAKSVRRPIGRIQARHNFKSYLQKLFSRAAWARVIRGHSDYSEITRTIVGAARTCLGRQRHLNLTSHENAELIASFLEIEKRGVPHLLVFSGNDNRWLEFQELVLLRHLGGCLTGFAYEIHVIAQANHELYLAAWQRELHDVFSGWLRQHFHEAGRRAHAASA